MIDVRDLKSVTIDSASSTATVGHAGLNQLEAVTELGKAGVAATGTEELWVSSAHPWRRGANT